ncbi:hypothetical protein CDD83_8812 [Cordyceps sp. RAO-2017]|nr:hypothetical protein CDD83_8812 [Cordyceps sp. RAO-2017]
MALTLTGYSGAHTGSHGTHTGSHTGATGATTGTHGTHTGTHTGAATGTHGTHPTAQSTGPAPHTAGPHSKDWENKLDPRVDSNLDGSKTLGKDKTFDRS